MARALFVTTSYPARPGDPSGHFVETEARQYANKHGRVLVVAPWPGEGAPPSSSSAERGVEVRWLSGGGAFGWPGALSRLRESPRRLVGAVHFVAHARRLVEGLGAFDAIIAHFILPSAWPIAVSAKGPLEVVAHGSDVKVVESLPRMARGALGASLLRRGARLRFVSDDLRRRFARATTSRVLDVSSVAPCAIDVHDAPSRETARARFAVGDARVAVVVGRLVASKDPIAAVRAAAEHAERVVVVGDGPLATEVQRACPRAVLVGRVERPEALAWIAAADVLVSASREEGASTVVREARALGTRVLAFPAGDIAERARTDPGIELFHGRP